MRIYHDLSYVELMKFAPTYTEGSRQLIKLSERKCRGSPNSLYVSSSNENGARGPKLVEHRICVLSHQASWSSKKINLAELARLRWIENRSREEVADHFGASIETVKMHIRHLRSGRIQEVGLSPDLVRAIKSSWR
jgi:hypothetical protein